SVTTRLRRRRFRIALRQPIDSVDQSECGTERNNGNHPPIPHYAPDADRHVAQDARDAGRDLTTRQSEFQPDGCDRTAPKADDSPADVAAGAFSQIAANL